MAGSYKRIDLKDLNDATVELLRKSIAIADPSDTRGVRRLCESVRDLNVIVQKDEHLQAVVELDRIRTKLIDLASESGNSLLIEDLQQGSAGDCKIDSDD